VTDLSRSTCLEVSFGAETREYRLRRSSRRTLGITVEPRGELLVTAPRDVSVERIEAVLRRRRSWILRRLRKAALIPPAPPERQWVTGETHRYLGRQYRLKVVESEKSGVKLLGKFFLVSAPTKTGSMHVKRSMERWYLDHAKNVFAERMQILIRQTPRLRLGPLPPLIVRRIRKRWGSCSSEGRILMNVDAVRLPMGCIDYLLLHELCHLRISHHGPAFWRNLDACMPDWEQWRRRLEWVEL
jgi:predicted metal-dependent hydrolase